MNAVFITVPIVRHAGDPLLVRHIHTGSVPNKFAFLGQIAGSDPQLHLVRFKCVHFLGLLLHLLLLFLRIQYGQSPAVPAAILGCSDPVCLKGGNEIDPIRVDENVMRTYHNVWEAESIFTVAFLLGGYEVCE